QLSVLSMLNAGTTGDEALRLVRYVFRHTDDDSRLTAAMRDVYERSGRPTPLVLAVYELMEGPARYDLLIEHLNLRPEDRMVFGRLAKDLVAEDPARLLGVTVRMMTLRPSEAARYARVLARHRVAADPLLALIEDQPDEYQAQAPALYLRGLAQRQSGRMGKARQAFEDSIKADPNFILPRLALVEMAMAAGRHDQAMALLKDVKESDQLLARRAEALLELSRLEEAGRDITLLLSRSPDKPAHHVLKARWLIKKGQTEEAVELLVSAQSRWPTHEPVYVELFELYERPPADREKVQKWAQLLAKARQHLPNSRVARVKAARAALNSRQFQLAEKLCDDLTHEFPSDGEIKAILAETYARTGRQDQGEKLLNDHIVQDPDDLQVVMAFRLINYDRFLEVFEAYWLRRPDTLEKWLSLYELYNIRHQREPDKGWDGKALVAIEKAVATDDPLLDYQHYALLGRQYGLLGKVEKGAAVFDKAIRKFPKHQVELLYQKSNLYSLRRDYAGAEKVLLKVLELEPKHPVANNDLGYFWAVQGRNLKRALTMTQTAVAAQPDSGAFLDSLGWVHYKLGNFTSAIRRLEEAVLRFEEEARQGAPSPGGVIADHLGDALWRNGQKQKAIGQWKIALAQARQRVEAGSVLDPDIKDLAQSLPKKIKRAEAGQHPLLAALPDQSLKALGKASETKINKQKTLLKKIGDPARDDWWRAQLEIVRQMDRLHDWHAVQQSPAAEALGQKTVRYIESLRKKHPQLGGETIRAAMESMLKKHRADTKQDDPSD
ncbi:MAG: tetratricopeptide repeat protein, partial [Phycisphaeraceae bacterium]|nr:tetratricopeptide repeat protein [Phycisphaeraceae bacterium]